MGDSEQEHNILAHALTSMRPLRPLALESNLILRGNPLSVNDTPQMA